MTTNPEKVGFISLGCPKALVDSERILTQLRFDGYEVTPNYEDAGVVIVNTCGFIDSAKAESLEAISEAVQENGRVLVTGCMGKGDDAQRIQDLHPNILGISGPAAYEEVVGAVHEVIPMTRQPDPLNDLIPAQGIKLTPRHYASKNFSTAFLRRTIRNIKLSTFKLKVPLGCARKFSKCFSVLIVFRKRCRHLINIYIFSPTYFQFSCGKPSV